MGMQRTARCARKIVAFLKVGISTKAFSIYRCAAADTQTVRPEHSTAPHRPFRHKRR
jgi:hypothetical protein